MMVVIALAITFAWLLVATCYTISLRRHHRRRSLEHWRSLSRVIQPPPRPGKGLRP